MKIYALWHGGEGNYAPGSVDDDLEVFPSLKAAEQALWSRNARGALWLQRFEYVNREPAETYTPCVGDDSNMWIWHGDPRGMLDPYPVQVIEFGPRGAVRRVAA